MSRVITDRAELLRFREDARRSGAKLVFTNGVFDLIHVGHLDSLRRARAEGDLLMVALNSDESVRRIKGEGRPILPLNQRMRILAALEFVNVATCFDEDTPEQIIRDVQPDVLVKGGDYQVHEIVGHDIVQAGGGRVLSLPVIEGYSTTNLIEVIKQRFCN